MRLCGQVWRQPDGHAERESSARGAGKAQQCCCRARGAPSASAPLRDLAIDMPARLVRFWTQRLATGLRNLFVASMPITMLVYSSLRGAFGLLQACGRLEPPPWTSRAHLRQFSSSMQTHWHAQRVQLDALGGKRFAPV